MADVQKSYYTLCFDETTNEESKKELQIRLRYFSETFKKVVVQHLETFFIENGKAETIVKYIQSALDNSRVSFNKMLTVSMDGPNVNKKVFRLLNEDFKSYTQMSLINIGNLDKYLIIVIKINLIFFVLQAVAIYIQCTMHLKLA